MVTQQEIKFSIRKDDQVEVIAGREKGKTGKVVKVNQKSGRVTVEKVNMVKRHMKPSQKYPQGGIVERELPLHYSNVLLVCPKCNKGVRHGRKLVEAAAKGKKKNAKAESAAAKKMVKVRVCKRCGESLDAA
ncbi:MAG: 50S ribosomal protein L24 [Oligoflexia bacterium]|nr:50S ribosomal protein L24 [Oligoflexia bacterium]